MLLLLLAQLSVLCNNKDLILKLASICHKVPEGAQQRSLHCRSLAISNTVLKLRCCCGGVLPLLLLQSLVSNAGRAHSCVSGMHATACNMQPPG